MCLIKGQSRLINHTIKANYKYEHWITVQAVKFDFLLLLLNKLCEIERKKAMAKEKDQDKPYLSRETQG